MKSQALLQRFLNFSILILILSLSSCATISSFDQQAYTQTTSLKVDALNVMDLATEDYASHEKDVKVLETNLRKLYEYEKNRPKNEITIKLWDKLMARDGHLLGGFLERWKDEGKLGRAFVDAAKKLVATGFDQIAGLESKKLKPSEIN